MRFSRRTAWPRTENALSRAIAAARERERGGLVDLTISNPTQAGLTYPEAAIRGALDAAPIDYRPAPLGLPGTREAVSSYYARRGIDVPPERIAIVASTSEGYGFLLRLLADPGDAVLFPKPSYPLFDFLLALNDVEAVPYRSMFDGSWHLDPTTLERAAAAILVVSPNNPTGTIHDAGERELIAAHAARTGAAIISDEVFADFLSPPSTHEDATWIDASDEALIFSLGGLSKSAGLPQLKLGWIVASGPQDAVAEAMSRLEIVGDTYLSVATPIQIALPAILEAAEPWQADLRGRIAQNTAHLREATLDTPCSVRPNDGGWYTMIDLPRTRTDEEWAIALAEQDGVAVHPGYLFDLEGGACLVASTIAEPRLFAEGITRVIRRASEG